MWELGGWGGREVSGRGAGSTPVGSAGHPHPLSTRCPPASPLPHPPTPRPQNAASWPTHLANCAFNSLLMGELVIPDWDM